jgi:hypothetical protein
MHTPNAALRSPIVVLLLTVWLAVCLPVYGQQTSSAPSTQALPDPKTKLTGYLVWKSDKVYLQTADSKKLFLLSGNIATLEEFEGCQLTLTGKITNDTANNGTSNSLPIFAVSRIVKSSAKHLPKLDASFENTATWVTERNNLNGIKFAHPTIVVFERSPDPSYSGASNFASDENVEKIVGLDIPDTAYPRRTSGAAPLRFM